MGTLLFPGNRRTTMVTTLLTFLLVLQGSSGKSMPQECCATKKVGEYFYTLIKTTGQVPPQCKKSCVYTRDSEEGSRYCFATGNLPVTCIEDTEDIPSNCYPGPPGPTGCPSDENLKITGIPDTQGFRPTSGDCYDYCTALCPPDIFPCRCNVWTYNTEDNMCYTFYSLEGYPCYQTIPEEGWVSGTPNCNTQTDEIKDLDSIPGAANQTTFSYGTFGDLFAQPDQKSYFDDQPKARGAITAVNMWVGNYTNNDVTTEEVIVGIQLEYLNIPANVHGSKNGKKKTCKASPTFTEITVNSIQDPSANPYTSLVYFLRFTSTDGTTCSAGIPGRAPSETIPKPQQGTSPIYIYGNILPETSSYPHQMLSNLFFKYQ